MRSKKAIKNIISSLLLQIVIVICGLILPKAIIEKYGSNVNGLISSITQFLSYITLLEAGIGPVIKSVLYKPIANKDKKQIESILKASQKFFNAISYIFVVYLIILCFVYPNLVNNEFSFGYTLSLIIIISISTFAEYFFGMTYKLYLQSEQKTYITANIQAGTVLLNTVSSVVLINLGVSIHIVKLVTAFIFVLRPVLQNIYVRKKYDINLKNVNNTYELKQKWDGLAQHIASVIHGNTDVAIITIFLNTTEVSVYTIYLLVINGVKNLIQSFTGGMDASFGDMIAKNEHKELNKSFKNFELFYYTIATIIYSCTIVLIVPFVTVYTSGIMDANYIRPVFASIIVIAEFMWSIRLPYSSITLAAGHFKETQKGAWVEAISNIVISIILVLKFGIIGVAIGTLFAMIIRTIEFMYHTNKYILKRKQNISIIRMLIIIIETGIIILMSQLIAKPNFVSYIEWIIYSIKVFIMSLVVIVPVNSIVYLDDVKDLLKILKRNIKKNI